MDDFLQKWHTDKKYRAKIKLLLYFVFIVFVTIFAASASRNMDLTNDDTDISDIINDSYDVKVIEVPDQYKYTIHINEDDNEYQYYGEKTTTNETITKTINGKTKEYIYENEEYYELIDNIYLKTTKDDVYDIINYNYINLNTINTYLQKASKIDDDYIVYLKDIVLNNDSDEYITININDQVISIDYTELMKLNNETITKYLVTIKLNSI